MLSNVYPPVLAVNGAYVSAKALHMQSVWKGVVGYSGQHPTPSLDCSGMRKGRGNGDLEYSRTLAHQHPPPQTSLEQMHNACTVKGVGAGQSKCDILGTGALHPKR